MGLIREGWGKIKCGLGIHHYFAYPVKVQVLLTECCQIPCSVKVKHECRRCGHGRSQYITLRNDLSSLDELAVKDLVNTQKILLDTKIEDSCDKWCAW